jgi:2-methylcitrate dehydratase PrpD
LAAAAGAAHLLGFDVGQTRSALALAAAQAGGLQRNFGSLAKPIQAGNAAAAGVRAAQLVAAGVTADQNIFGARGYFDLYGGAGVQRRLHGIEVRYQLGSLSRKLFPCCYASHRLIGAAIKARKDFPEPVTHDISVSLSVPFGTMRPLRVSDPQTGEEGQFCAAYLTAVALLFGGVSLRDFEIEAVRRPEVRALMKRIKIVEAPAPDPLPVGFDHGAVALTVFRADTEVTRAEVRAFPGSPAAPASREEIAAKVADCLTLYSRRKGRELTPDAFRATVYARAGGRAISAA